MKVREWLKKLRLQEKLTQDDVAKQIKITRAGYAMIENGDRNPSVKVAKRIAEVLGFEDKWYKLLEPSESA